LVHTNQIQWIQRAGDLGIRLAYALAFIYVVRVGTVIRQPNVLTVADYVPIGVVLNVEIQRGTLEEDGAGVVCIILDETRGRSRGLGVVVSSHNGAASFISAEIRPIEHGPPSPVGDDRVFNNVASKYAVLKLHRHAATFWWWRDVLKVCLWR